jgi:hypothetical protein
VAGGDKETRGGKGERGKQGGKEGKFQAFCAAFQSDSMNCWEALMAEGISSQFGS